MIKKGVISALFVLFSWVISAQDHEPVPFSELPTPVQESVKADYKKYTVNKSMVTKLKTGTVVYKVEVQKKTTLWRLVYDDKGALLSKSKTKAFTFDGTEPTGPKEGAQGNPIPPM